MVGRKYTTFYLPLLKLAYILSEIEVYNAGSSAWGRDPLPQFFSTKCSFCYFFATFVFWRYTIISDLDFYFERVLKLQQLPYSHPRTQALCKSSETIDDMKLDSSSLKYMLRSKTLPECLKMTSKH